MIGFSLSVSVFGKTQLDYKIYDVIGAYLLQKSKGTWKDSENQPTGFRFLMISRPTLKILISGLCVKL